MVQYDVSNAVKMKNMPTGVYHSNEREPASEPWEDITLDPCDLAEQVDLDESTKKKILYLYKRLDTLNHFQLLQVNRRADAKAIKKAYFSVSKDFHPDSFFRKNVGSFHAKIEAIFKRINLAYEVLSNEQKRKAYEATIPHQPTQEEIVEQRLVEREKMRDDKLKQERRERLIRRTPLPQRREQARQHYQEALEFQKQNNFVQATNNIRMAIALDPDNKEYKKLLEDVQPKSSEIRSQHEQKRARYEESQGNTEDALTAYIRAIELYPNDVESLYHAAAIMLTLQRDLHRAISFCRKAAQLVPENHDISYTLANLYEVSGMHLNALREYQRYAQLNPMDEIVITKIKDLKKKI
jgi:curved DNA-binding protein CbpA